MPTKTNDTMTASNIQFLCYIVITVTTMCFIWVNCSAAAYNNLLYRLQINITLSQLSITLASAHEWPGFNLFIVYRQSI